MQALYHDRLMEFALRRRQHVMIKAALQQGLDTAKELGCVSTKPTLADTAGAGGLFGGRGNGPQLNDENSEAFDSVFSKILSLAVPGGGMILTILSSSYMRNMFKSMFSSYVCSQCTKLEDIRLLIDGFDKERESRKVHMKEQEAEIEKQLEERRKQQEDQEQTPNEEDLHRFEALYRSRAAFENARSTNAQKWAQFQQGYVDIQKKTLKHYQVPSNNEAIQVMQQAMIDLPIMRNDLKMQNKIRDAPILALSEAAKLLDDVLEVIARGTKRPEVMSAKIKFMDHEIRKELRSSDEYRYYDTQNNTFGD